MCGITGIAGEIHVKEEKVLRTLLVLDSVRGEDSTGVAFIPRNGEVIVAKGLGNPFELFDSRKWNGGMKITNRAIIGHNRFATSGGVSKKTAHPFEFETLVGVHNGTLTNKWCLADSTMFTVDSENLYHHIQKKGLKDALNTVSGAYALVWWDKVEESLNFLRNKERPLYMAKSVDGKVLVWASEEWMITVACNRHDMKIGEIIPIVEDMHYEFSIPDSAKIGKPTIRHAPMTYTPPVYVDNQQLWKSNTFTPPVTQKPTSNVVDLVVPEKKDSLTKTIGIDKISTHLGKKDLLLEITGLCTDVHGSKYIKLMDGEHPAVEFRLYCNARDPRTYTVGHEVTGDVGGWSASKGDGDYFKVVPSSIALVPYKKENFYLYDDGNGHKLTRKEWETKFPNCDWCFDPLYAEDHGNRLNGTGGCFCGKCAENKEATEHSVLKSVY